jgi:hypothetical protein
MFIPTEFPCTAWHVTAALNVREVILSGYYNQNWFQSTPKGALLYVASLFNTRDEAVAGAEEQLAVEKVRLDRAAARIAKRSVAVASLRGTPGV